MRKEVIDTKNILDLSNIDSRDLIKELKSRGYYTAFVYDTSDVTTALELINGDHRNPNEHIVLSEDDKLEIINNCFEDNGYFDIDNVFVELNTAVDNYILNEYDNEHYYQKTQN
jgi:hypothetical protein